MNISLWLHCNCNDIDIRKVNGAEQWDAAQAVGGGHAQRSFQLRVVKCVACGACVKACPEKALEIAER